MKCPKCQNQNPETLKFCGECGTQLVQPGEPIVSMTKTMETAVEELTTGSTFADRYQIIEELGKGGMGRVYKVQDTEIREKVALKLLKPEIASDEKTIERFRNEIKLARKIGHKNVGRMYDLGRAEGSYFITMEFVEGQDLKGLIRQTGQLAVGTTINIAKQICEGLAEAHRLGVVHRDLKPSNIMIDRDGSARIMDFGIARTIKGKGITGEGVIIGTPEYMSPEQVEGKEVDQRSDIYSLGIILYEMVTGRVPFEGNTPFTIGVKHKSEIPKDPKDLNAQIPDDLSHVILKCLQKQKEKRYQTIEEVLSDFKNIKDGLPTTEKIVTKRKPLTSKEITVTFGLKKLLIPALVVVAVVIIVIIIWRLIPRKEPLFVPKIENSIAVISFNNQTGDTSFDYLQEAIPNLLITNLEQTEYFYVATWERMHDILKQMGEEDVEIIGRDLGFELCRREGIESIILGSYIKAGDTFAMDVKVLDVETKKLLKSASAKGEGIDSILKTQIDVLSREIAQGLGLARQKLEQANLRISDATTSSMEAYNHLLKGKEYWEKQYFDDARQHLEKAVDLDPEFAVAHFYLARTHSRLRNIRAENEAWDKAKLYSSKASDKDRLWIEARYTQIVEKDPEKAFGLFKEIARKYPKEKIIRLAVGQFYRQKKQYTEALEEFEKALEMDPSYKTTLNLTAYTYAEMGDYEKALEYFRKYADVSPGDANPLDSMGDLYFMMGRLDEAIAKYKEALEIKPEFGAERWISYIYAVKGDYSETLKWADQFIERAPSPGLKAQGYLLKSFYLSILGRTGKAIEELSQAEDIWKTDKNFYGLSVADMTRGLIYFESGQYELSRKQLKKYFDFNYDFQPQYLQQNRADDLIFTGLIDLKEGRIDLAKSKLEEAKSLLPESFKEGARWAGIQKFNCVLLQIEILMAERSYKRAAEVIENTQPPEMPDMSAPSIMRLNMPILQDTFARVYQQMGELDKAIAAYEDLITFDSSSKDRRLVHPIYHYRVAILYEQKGWKGKAIEHYEKFLDLWKDADPEFSEVEDAKKRLVSLQN